MALRRLLLCLALAGAAVAPVPAAADEKAGAPRTEAEMKAYFMINFVRFVVWPEEAGPPATEERSLPVGILGRDPFGGALETYAGQVIKGRRIVLRRARDLKELQDCRVLFLGESGEALARDLKALKGKGVLTFGESEDFIPGGGIVRFVMQDRQVHMQVNRRAATEERLQISSRLLAITTVVNP